MATKVMTTTSTWKGGALFEHTPPSGKTYMTDARSDVFPKETVDAPSPVEVLLGALTGCTGIDVVSTLTKMRMQVKSLTFEVEAERREDNPRTFTKIRVVYNLDTDPIDMKKALRAIALSVNKYCSVSAVLAASAEMTYTLRCAGEEHHGTIHQ